MAALTQSGFPVVLDYGDPALIGNPPIPGAGGVKALGGLRAGDVATVLLHVAARWYAEVETYTQDDGVWGFTPKKITGGDGSTWSNHAGGCAIDIAAARHPQGQATMSATQVAAVRRIIADVNALAGTTVLDWGGEWSGSTKDEMHVQLTGNVSTLALAVAAQKIAGSQPATTPTTAPTAPGGNENKELSMADVQDILDRIAQVDTHLLKDNRAQTIDMRKRVIADVRRMFEVAFESDAKVLAAIRAIGDDT